MSKLVSGIKQFVHSLSTGDHYASYDPDRPTANTGNGDTTRLTSSVGPSSGAAGLSSPVASASASTTSLGRLSSSEGYTPGSRSAQLNRANAGTSGIPLSELPADGPPIPSPELSWERILDWLDRHFAELSDQVLDGVTENDLLELEHDLDCNLPADVRESLLLHDGQESGGRPTGLFFGISVLSLDDIASEWTIWRNTAVRLNDIRRGSQGSVNPPAQPGPSNRPVPPVGPLGWADRQRSVPQGAVQCVYAHPSWIPLAKDYEGNNIGIDLAPGPRGRFGQVILFGREFDTKYVIAPSWGDFLAQFSSDLDHAYVDDDVENPVFAFSTPAGRLISYFEVLRQRVLARYPQKPSMHRESSARQRRSASPAASSSEMVSTMPTTTSKRTNTMSEPIMKLTPTVATDAGVEVEDASGDVSVDTPNTTEELEPDASAVTAKTDDEPRAKLALKSDEALADNLKDVAI